MSRIYFNEETGEFWETNIHHHNPPEGFTRLVGKMDYRYSPSYYIAESYYCPICKKYHPFFFARRRHLPLWAEFTIKWGKMWGCEIARKLVEISDRFGGRRKSYHLVEEAYRKNKDILDISSKSWRLENKYIKNAFKMIVQGKSLEEVKSYLLSKCL